MHDNLNPEDVWTVPTEVLEALKAPTPTTEADELIASTGLEWPVRVVSWSEPVDRDQHRRRRDGGTTILDYRP